MANRIGFQATGFAASIDSQPRGDRRAGEPELSGSASRCASFKKSIHVASADAQSVYVAPGGVYVGGGPVYLIPGAEQRSTTVRGAHLRICPRKPLRNKLRRTLWY